MTCRTAILIARAHAALVESVEACASAVSDGYLDRAVRRMRLPVKVRADFTLAGSPQWWVYSDPVKDDFCDYYNAAEATRAYLKLCDDLVVARP